ncbi:MAG: hypothetical protein DMF79_06600 [Acidobacteria bacterium]|nr:MAG: hypothetical protein DMF79_06600 [Acidobacteriota bacterium]
MAVFGNKRVIVGSVAGPGSKNLGNRLIARSTLRLLGLDESTPSFSVFEPISEARLELINSHDYVVITGATTLQDDPGHQACFDAQFGRIRIPRICVAGSFYCEPGDRPSLRIARLFDTPVGARDPWTADYLARHGIDCELVGCPTLLVEPGAGSWRDGEGAVLVSSSPELAVDLAPLLHGRPVRYLRHEAGDRGEDPGGAEAFDGASLVVTGRLHAALPAIGRGVRVRFFGPDRWRADLRAYEWGTVRYTLLRHLGIRLDGAPNPDYPGAAIRRLRSSFTSWLDRAVSA